MRDPKHLATCDQAQQWLLDLLNFWFLCDQTRWIYSSLALHILVHRHTPAYPADWYRDECKGVTSPRTPAYNYTDPEGFHELVARQPPLTDSDGILIDDLARRRCQCLMSVDDAHAALVAKTKELGVFEKTYFVISSDHGSVPVLTPPSCLGPPLSNQSIGLDDVYSCTYLIMRTSARQVQPWAPSHSIKQVPALRPRNTDPRSGGRPWHQGRRPEPCPWHQRRLRADLACNGWHPLPTNHGRPFNLASSHPGAVREVPLGPNACTDTEGPGSTSDTAMAYCPVPRVLQPRWAEPDAPAAV